MVRLFHHYISAKFIGLAVLDSIIFLFAFRLGLEFNDATEPAIIDSVGSTIQFFAALAVPATAALVFAFGMLAVMKVVGLYDEALFKNLRPIWFRAGFALCLSAGLVYAIAYLAPSLHLGRRALVIILGVAFGGAALIRIVFWHWRTSIAFKRRVLVLGTGSRVVKLAEMAQNNYNHFVVGYVPCPPTDSHQVPALQVLPMSPSEPLQAIAAKHSIKQIVIAVRDRRGEVPVRDLLECRMKGVNIIESAAFFEQEYRQVSQEWISTSWMMLSEGFRQGLIKRGVKRLFDVVVSLALLVVALPLMLIAAIFIVLESGFPIIYRQERVGQLGHVFWIYKLRSMKNNAESGGKPMWAATNDVRTTRVGRVIRKLRIDELPQIFNVLKNDMSFVGPRPERPYFVDQLVTQMTYYSLRHTVKPGITGWAQVRYPYGSSINDTIEKLQYDLYYVKNNTLFLDLLILLDTIEVVVTGKGAR